MKHKPKSYAKALSDALSQKNADKKKIAKNFIILLQKNQDLKKANEILRMAEALLLAKTGNKKVILETARKMDISQSLSVFIKKGDLVQERINPKLVAGVKMVVDGNRQLDMSLLHKLENIF